MKHYQFQVLDEPEKLEVIWEHGVMVGNKVKGENKLDLYQVFSFYVELFYHMEHHALKGLKSFSSIKVLNAHLNEFEGYRLECKQ